MNGVEGNLAIAALYYFSHIKPVLLDSNLAKMTLLITISFLARSSSLAAWIPLALFKINEDPSFILPIIVAFLSVTVSMIASSIALDSFYYGTFTIPQWNFVNINVVENASKYFGIDPWYFYINGFQEEFCTLYFVGLFGLSLVTIR